MRHLSAVINYHAKRVDFKNLGEVKFTFYISVFVSPPCFASTLQAQKLLLRRLSRFLATMVKAKSKGQVLENTPVVREIFDIFSYYLARLSSEKET